MSDNNRQADVLDRWWDGLVSDDPFVAPTGRSDLTETIRVVHERDNVSPADPLVSDRVWQRILAVSSPRQIRPRLQRRMPRILLAPLVAVLLAALLVGFAIESSAAVQAQVRRLSCLVPVFGVQDCDSPGLVATQPVSSAQGDMTVSLLYLLSSAQQTSLRMELRGLPADLSSGLSPVDHPELSPEQRSALQSTRITLRTDLGETLEAEPVSGSGQAGPTQYATLRALHAVDSSVTAPRLSTEVEWTLPPLNTAVRSVEVVLTAGQYAWSLHVGLVPLQRAGLASASESGPVVTRDGVSVWVDGVARGQDDRLLVQLAGRASDGQVIGFGDIDPNTGVFSRAMWHASGHAYLDDARRCCPMTDHTTGDTHFQDLTFQNVPKGTQLRTLELPFVMVRRQLPPATLTIDVAGHAAGDRIPVDTDLRIGDDILRVLGATLEDDGSLLIEFDFGDWPNGRRLGLPLEISVGGRTIDPRSVRTVARDLGTTPGFARYLTQRVPLPQPLGSQLQLTISSPGVTYRGPWLLPLPVGPTDIGF
jgi:hypothetical protein